jgi:UDP-N-acetylglucosamine 3-dehydrogenase
LVRIGLVGCGLFGESHLQAYRSVRSARIVAVFDLDARRAARIAATFGIRRICRSLDEMCGIVELDAVDVVTPEPDHLDSVVRALRAGKHVFVEKPLATKLKDCDTMIRTAESSGRFLMPGHLLRFETKYAMLKDEVTAGRLGGVVSMHARRNRPKSLFRRYGRTHPAIENCIHDIDLMLWYSPGRVRRVRGYARRAGRGPNPDTFWGILEFDNGTLGVVETIWLAPDAGIVLDDSFRLVGKRGTASIALVPGALTLWRGSGFETPDICYDPRVAKSARGALREELMYFCDCVLDNRPPSVITGSEAKRAVKVALALVESAHSGRDVKVEDT